ncbi:MAG TPA: DUF1707 domain-containing protein [Solirubrobacteraceae bacterium]|nr:DUF1707 domain-containing protein [Solirubrobacteraceae bacterium]
MAQYGPYDRSLRAADSDRESVADILRDQHIAGRLDDDELQDRIERCYTAKTYAELDAVIADLPHDEPTASHGREPRLWPRFAFVPVLLLIAIVALSHGHLAWLVIPFAFLFVRPMLWRAGGRRVSWGPFGCAPRHDTYV